MPIYRNNLLKSKTEAEVQAGPYTFKHGLIRTTTADDSTVGPILTTFYGCEKLSDDEEKALNDKVKAASTKAKADLDKQDPANPSTGKQDPAALTADPKDLNPKAPA